MPPSSLPATTRTAALSGFSPPTLQHLLIDINGYFAPPAAGGLSLYALTPCRVLDTRKVGNGQPFSGRLTVNVARQFLRTAGHGASLCLQCHGCAARFARLPDVVAGRRAAACGLDAERHRRRHHLEPGDRTDNERDDRCLRQRPDTVAAGHLQLLRAVDWDCSKNAQHRLNAENSTCHELVSDPVFGRHQSVWRHRAPGRGHADIPGSDAVLPSLLA